MPGEETLCSRIESLDKIGRDTSDEVGDRGPELVTGDHARRGSCR